MESPYLREFDYNYHLPYSFLGQLMPREYADQYQQQRVAWG